MTVPIGRAHDLGDLLVGEALDVGEVDRHAELLGDLLQGPLDVAVRQVVERLGLGRAQAAGGVRLRTGQLVVLDLGRIRLLRLALLLAVGVDVGVGEDAVQPGLEVRARAGTGGTPRTPWRTSPGRGPRRRRGCASCAARRSRAGPGTASPPPRSGRPSRLTSRRRRRRWPRLRGLGRAWSAIARSSPPSLVPSQTPHSQSRDAAGVGRSREPVRQSARAFSFSVRISLDNTVGAPRHSPV